MGKENNHFDLTLNVKTEKEKTSANYRIAVLKGYIENAEQGQFPHLKLANLHLIAVLYYYTNKLDEACKAIEEILKEDPDNRNGHANMAFLCERILLSRKAEYHLGRVEKLDQNPDIWIKSRSSFEFAYAHAFEAYREVDELKRYCESNVRLGKCLENTRELATENEHKLERAEWMMCIIWNLKKIYNRNYNTEQPESKNVKFYEDIMDTLLQITNSVPEDSHLNSMAYTYFGYFFWKKPVAPSHKREGDDTSQVKMPDVLSGHEVGKHFNNPEWCFKKALEIHKSIETLQQYGCWLLNKSRFEDAAKQFTEAIEINGSHSNYFSFSKRGESLMKRIQGRRNDINLTPESQDFKDLKLIVKDFMFVVEVNPSSYIYQQLALCYFYLSNKGSDPEMTLLSMSAFQQGLACMDGKADSRLHLKHAECLKAIGEDKHAMFSMQRSVENQNPQSTFVYDIKQLLTWYQESWKNEDIQIINEAQFWFQMAFTKYKKDEFKRMMCELVKVEDTRDFYIRLFSVCWQKSSAEMKRFCCEVLKTILPHDHPLVQFFQPYSILDAPPAAPLKSSKSMQPRNLKGYDYDFYVIHSDEDYDWVVYSLLGHLEHMRNFKGMLSDRDSPVGTSLFENLKTAVEKSYKIILVITPNFEKSHWCKHETEHALIESIEKCQEGRIIPIIKDKANVPDSLGNLKNINMDENSFKETDLENLVRALDN